MDAATPERFDVPSETRVMVKGRFELVHVGMISRHFLGAEPSAAKKA